MLLLGRKTSIERVAAFLIEMDERLTAAHVMALPMCRRDIADYLGVHPMYGTIEDFNAFLKAAHDRGLQVMIEMVMRSVPQWLVALFCAGALSVVAHAAPRLRPPASTVARSRS